jgi:hypothetical protein
MQKGYTSVSCPTPFLNRCLSIWIDGVFLFYRDDTRGERSAIKKGGKRMQKSLTRILICAKEMNKWVPIRYLVKYRLHEFDLLQLEDQGLLLVNRRATDGLLIKLIFHNTSIFWEFPFKKHLHKFVQMFISVHII